ncbi:MAG: response regulator [Chloroflexales bacterium]|nr:response regulator [Chloroflexales bacterium]
MTQSQCTIVVIDDDIALQALLEFALRNAGYDVVVASDGLDGIEQLSSLSPRLVLCDIMMPNMDGVEVFQRIKNRLQNDGIPIIIMTALNRKPWFADLEAEGAVIIQKPFEVERLIEIINLNVSE